MATRGPDDFDSTRLTSVLDDTVEVIEAKLRANPSHAQGHKLVKLVVKKLQAPYKALCTLCVFPTGTIFTSTETGGLPCNIGFYKQHMYIAYTGQVSSQFLSEFTVSRVCTVTELRADMCL